MGLHLFLRPPSLKKKGQLLTQVTQLEWAASSVDCGLRVRESKVVAAVTMVHLQGAPPAHALPSTLTAVANLPLEKALSKPLSFILYKPHHIIRLLKICSSSRSEAIGLQASPISRAVSMELISRSKESRATPAPAGPAIHTA